MREGPGGARRPPASRALCACSAACVGLGGVVDEGREMSSGCGQHPVLRGRWGSAWGGWGSESANARGRGGDMTAVLRALGERGFALATLGATLSDF